MRSWAELLREIKNPLSKRDERGFPVVPPLLGCTKNQEYNLTYLWVQTLYTLSPVNGGVSGAGY